MRTVGSMIYAERQSFARTLHNLTGLMYRGREEELNKYYDLIEAWVRGEAHTLSDEEIEDLEKLILKAAGLD